MTTEDPDDLSDPPVCGSYGTIEKADWVVAGPPCVLVAVRGPVVAGARLTPDCIGPLSEHLRERAAELVALTGCGEGDQDVLAYFAE